MADTVEPTKDTFIDNPEKDAQDPEKGDKQGFTDEDVDVAKCENDEIDHHATPDGGYPLRETAIQLPAFLKGELRFNWFTSLFGLGTYLCFAVTLCR